MLYDRGNSSVTYIFVGNDTSTVTIVCNYARPVRSRLNVNSRSNLFILVSCGLYKSVLRCPAVFRQMNYLTMCY